MKPLTPEEIELAYQRWFREHYSYKEFEAEVAPYLSDKLEAFAPSRPKSWLRQMRESLFLSEAKVASYMQMSQQAYAQYEKNEERGTITLNSLAKAARALDCELVYGLRPIQKSSPAKIIWEKLLSTARQHYWLRRCDQRRRGWALAWIAETKMKDPKFRRDTGWTQS